MHALILLKLHPNLCKNSRSLDHLKTLRKPHTTKPQLFFGKIFEFLPPTYTWKFQTISHVCLILHLGENIFPEQGHAFFVFFFMKDKLRRSLQSVKATLLVNLSMWRVFFGAGFPGCRATWAPSNWRQATCLQYVPSQNRKGCFELLWMITISVFIFVVDDPHFNYIRKFIKNTQTHTLNPT